MKKAKVKNTQNLVSKPSLLRGLSAGSGPSISMGFLSQSSRLGYLPKAMGDKS